LVDMMTAAIEVQVNVMAAQKSKQEGKKTREEDQPSSSSSSDVRFDMMMKTMEKMMERLSINNIPSPREHQELEIRNPNFRRPVAHQNRPREPRNHDEANQHIKALFPKFFVTDESEDFLQNEILCCNPDEPTTYLTKEEYERFVTSSIMDSDQVAQLSRSEQYKLGYENVVLYLQKKYDLRNRNVILKLPPKPQSQAPPTSSQQQTPFRQPSVTQSQPLPKQQSDFRHKAHQ